MRAPRRRPRVVVLYKSLPQYRRRFFELVRARLDAASVDFELVYGDPSRVDGEKADTVDLPWATYVANRWLRVGGLELIWQPVLRQVSGADLVIVEQASKLLVNGVLQLRASMRIGPKFAFWGHGKNFQGHDASWLGELVKRTVANRAHWWFAYNEMSAEVVRSYGFPDSRITRVQNAIDTRALAAARAQMTDQDLDDIRRELNIRGRNVAAFAGGMYPEKRLPFLIEACEVIREAIPDFEIVLIGGGVDSSVVAAAAARHPWIHYLGPQFEAAKVRSLSVAKVFLMPGLVGLGILDAFALELPIVTTAIPYHSPEIEYLENGVNGLMLEHSDDVAGYARAVVRLLLDESERTRLVAGCRVARDRYTVEEMVERFSTGVLRALEPH